MIIRRIFAVVLTLAALCQWSGVAQAQQCKTIASYDFENGIPGNWSKAYSAFKKAKVPASVQADPGGNNFLRITATPQDLTYTAGQSSIRVRSEASVGGFSAKEGDILTYDFSLRLGNNAPPGPSILMQLFQYGTSPNLGYAVKGDGTGPSVWLVRGKNGELHIGNFYNCTYGYQDKILGHIPVNQFVNVSIKVHWSLDPTKGRVDVYFDGKPAGSLSGAPTMLCPQARPRAAMHSGTYGDGGVGVVDFDNIGISSGSGCSAPVGGSSGGSGAGAGGKRRVANAGFANQVTQMVNTATQAISSGNAAQLTAALQEQQALQRAVSSAAGCVLG